MHLEKNFGHSSMSGLSHINVITETVIGKMVEISITKIDEEIHYEVFEAVLEALEIIFSTSSLSSNKGLRV